MALTLFNTLTRQKEAFVPKGDKVGFYACGPTVYHYAHLGNLRAYVFADTLRRALLYNGFRVEEVINITDVGHLVSDADDGEDKMEKGAAREGKSVWDIAQFYTDAFMEDINALNIQMPEHWTKATDHIPEQWELTKRILDNGYAYFTADGIYFDTKKLPTYGKLIPNFDPEKLEAGKRVDMGDKRAVTDFALWKFSDDEQRQMEWETTMELYEVPEELRAIVADNPNLGLNGNTLKVTGFPGWHIECTAMGTKYLGERFDIHTGGIDHIPIHHTNEIAQAEGAFGHDHVRYWLHNEFLVDQTGKMAKSKGDFLRLQTIIDKGFHPLDYRYFLLQTHYRKSVTFSWEALEAAKTARKRLTDRIIALKRSTMEVPELSKERIEWQSRFTQSMNDDLNAPQAIGLLNEMLKSSLNDADKLSLALDWDQVLGLNLKAAEESEEEIPQEVQALAEEREKARKDKDWEKSDELRDAIKEKGWVVSDTPEGPRLERA